MHSDLEGSSGDKAVAQTVSDEKQSKHHKHLTLLELIVDGRNGHSKLTAQRLTEEDKRKASELKNKYGLTQELLCGSNWIVASNDSYFRELLIYCLLQFTEVIAVRSGGAIKHLHDHCLSYSVVGLM